MQFYLFILCQTEILMDYVWHFASFALRGKLVFEFGLYKYKYIWFDFVVPMWTWDWKTMANMVPFWVILSPTFLSPTYFFRFSISVSSCFYVTVVLHVDCCVWHLGYCFIHFLMILNLSNYLECFDYDAMCRFMQIFSLVFFMSSDA